MGYQWPSGYGGGVMEYQLVSADSHVNEPPDLWVDRVPARFRDRAPRMESFDQGDAWVLDRGRRVRPTPRSPVLGGGNRQEVRP